jgi:hypothetical protein
VRFEAGSKLIRIEAGAFQESGLTAIVIPASVEILGKKCFSWCQSFVSITFENESQLREVGLHAFNRTRTDLPPLMSFKLKKRREERLLPNE